MIMTAPFVSKTENTYPVCAVCAVLDTGDRAVRARVRVLALREPPFHFQEDTQTQVIDDRY